MRACVVIYTRDLAKFSSAQYHFPCIAALARCICLDVVACIAPHDQAYYRKTREERLGMTLEQFVAGSPEVILSACHKGQECMFLAGNP